MKYKNLIRLFLIKFCLFLLILDSTAQSNNDKALAAADTSYFSVNKKEGWQIYNSYAYSVGADSVQLEAIVQHDANLDWKTSSYIGKIKSAGLRPRKTSLAQFNLLNTVFEVKVQTDGECYLKLISGSLPPGNPTVIAVRILYKK